MRVSLDPSYVLHGRPYQESSLLLEAFSRAHGRVGLIARGARGSRSRWKNVLQPFRPLLLSWNQKGELGTMTAADQVASPPPLAEEALFCGLYANELTMRFLQRSDPHPGLFDRYRQLVAELATGLPSQPALRMYEVQLLQAAGFGMQLEHEYGTADLIRADAWYQYVPEAGPKRSAYDAQMAAELVSGAALIGLKSGNIEDRHLQELKALMRRLIRFYLGDKPLNSQSLFY